jgi:hypothetical protein
MVHAGAAHASRPQVAAIVEEEAGAVAVVDAAADAAVAADAADGTVSVPAPTPTPVTVTYTVGTQWCANSTQEWVAFVCAGTGDTPASSGCLSTLAAMRRAPLLGAVVASASDGVAVDVEAVMAGLRDVCDSLAVPLPDVPEAVHQVVVLQRLPQRQLAAGAVCTTPLEAVPSEVQGRLPWAVAACRFGDAAAASPCAAYVAAAVRAGVAATTAWQASMTATHNNGTAACSCRRNPPADAPRDSLLAEVCEQVAPRSNWSALADATLLLRALRTAGAPSVALDAHTAAVRAAWDDMAVLCGC